MKPFLTGIALTSSVLVSLFSAASALSQDRYTSVEMSITIDAPAEEAWSKIGEYCDIGEWLGLDCVITEGEGGMGTVRELAGGRISEILIAQTPLSYGYTQPAIEGQFYDLYHGFMEARPVDEDRTELLYTLVYDVSNLADEEAVEVDRERRRGMFAMALQNMKRIAEED